jgi:hypothetical protein
VLKRAFLALAVGAIVAAALWGDTGGLWPLDCENSTTWSGRRRLCPDGLGAVDLMPSHSARVDALSDMPECLLCDG